MGYSTTLRRTCASDGVPFHLGLPDTVQHLLEARNCTCTTRGGSTVVPAIEVARVAEQLGSEAQ